MGTAQLVNISLMPVMEKGHTKEYAGFFQDEAQRLITALVTPVPKEYSDYINAVTEFWHAIGSKAMCTECFKGELNLDLKHLENYGPYKRDGKSNGCCGLCPLLTSEGCARKPHL